MQTMYEQLQAHIAKHAYKSGKNKGDAPLDSSRRSRSHERVSPRSDHIAVHFHNTDVIKAYQDGRIEINCDGYAGRPTTRACVNDALRWFGGNNAWLYSDRVYGKTQLVLKTRCGTYAYYDGITIDPSGEITSEPKPFEGRRIDREATKEMYADMQECGFKDVFKVLHAVSERLGAANQGDALRERVFQADSPQLRHFITSDRHANKWPHVVEVVSFKQNFNWQTHMWEYQKLDYKTAWNNLMTRVKKDLYDTVKIEEDTPESTK